MGKGPQAQIVPLRSQGRAVAALRSHLGAARGRARLCSPSQTCWVLVSLCFGDRLVPTPGWLSPGRTELCSAPELSQTPRLGGCSALPDPTQGSQSQAHPSPELRSFWTGSSPELSLPQATSAHPAAAWRGFSDARAKQGFIGTAGTSRRALEGGLTPKHVWGRQRVRGGCAGTPRHGTEPRSCRWSG